MPVLRGPRGPHAARDAGAAGGWREPTRRAGRCASSRTSTRRFERQEVVVHAPAHARSLAELDDAAARARRGGVARRAPSRRAEGLPRLRRSSTRATTRARACRTRTRSSSGCRSRRCRSRARRWLPPLRLPGARAHEGAGSSRAGRARPALPVASRSPTSAWSRRLDTSADGFAQPAARPRARAARRGRAAAARRDEGPRPLNAWLHDAGTGTSSCSRA